jgi:hypothetical protein
VDDTGAKSCANGVRLAIVDALSVVIAQTIFIAHRRS